MTVLALAAPLIGVLLMLGLQRQETWLVADLRKVRFAAPTMDGRSRRLPGIAITTIHRIRITSSNSQVGSGAAEFGDSAAGLG